MSTVTLTGLGLGTSTSARATAPPTRNDERHPQGANSSIVAPTSEFSETMKFSAEDRDGVDNLGDSVALTDDGTTALIGAPREEGPNGTATGAVYVFSRNEGTWVQQHKITPDDGDSTDRFDRFGASVALTNDGTIALIGARWDDNPNGDNAGAVYVFEQSNGIWSQKQKLTPDDGDSEDQFGRSIALTGDGATALIGASGDEDRAGSAYVFTRSDGTWTQSQKLAADDGDSIDLFGTAVALAPDGTAAVIGAPRDEDPNGRAAGSAYVFTQDDGTWTQQQKLASNDADARGGFGSSVTISTEHASILVGAENDESPHGADTEPMWDAGAVYAFTQSNGTWIHHQKIAPDDVDSGDLFGTAVVLSADGETALIGASRDEGPNGVGAGDAYAAGAGAAYVITRNEGSWVPQSKLVPEDGDSGDHFGEAMAVATGGETALAGAPRDEGPNGDSAGAAYLFTQADDTAQTDSEEDSKTQPPSQTRTTTSSQSEAVSTSDGNSTSTTDGAAPGFGVLTAVLGGCILFVHHLVRGADDE